MLGPHGEQYTIHLRAILYFLAILELRVGIRGFFASPRGTYIIYAIDFNELEKNRGV